MSYQIGASARPELALAVVVGAGGLAMAVARRLGQDYRLLLADRDAAHLERRISALREGGHDATGLECDITRAADVAALAAAAAAAGPVRALVNVVGLSPSVAGFSDILSVNLVGAARVGAAFEPIMAPLGCGLFISSAAAHLGAVDEALWPLLDEPLAEGFLARLRTQLGEKATPAAGYALSKAALNRMCRRAAPSWGERGLRLLSLSPGLIATPMGAREFASNPAKHRLLAAVPLAREGTMLEIANVTAFLVSDQASFLTGTDILADGGMVAAMLGR